MHADYDVNGLTACEQEQIARQIFYPKSGYEMHVSYLFNSKQQNYAEKEQCMDFDRASVAKYLFKIYVCLFFFCMENRPTH